MRGCIDCDWAKKLSEEWVCLLTIDQPILLSDKNLRLKYFPKGCFLRSIKGWKSKKGNEFLLYTKKKYFESFKHFCR